MSLWDFVGGAADAMLDKRKRDMASQLQKDLEEQRRNFQERLEQQRAEREYSRDQMAAEQANLDRRAMQDEKAQLARERAEERQYGRERDLRSDQRSQAYLDLQREAISRSSAPSEGGSSSGGLAKLSQAQITTLATNIARIEDSKARAQASALFEAGDYEGARAIIARGSVIPSASEYGIFE